VTTPSKIFSSFGRARRDFLSAGTHRVDKFVAKGQTAPS
jgi:hypothetical protein